MRSCKATIAVALSVLIAASSCSGAPDLPAGLYARIDTAKGPITVLLAYDKAPLAVANFVGLAEGTLNAYPGRKFYDGLTFHRVEENFVVQGGDPAGDGSGDPGYNFPDEFDPSLRHDAPGVAAFANYGADTNGSQFYITLAAAPVLDDSYTVFGRVIEGMDVVGKLVAGDVMTKVTILRIGEAAKSFKSDQAAWDQYYTQAAEGAKARIRATRKTVTDGLLATWPGLVLRPDGIMSMTLKEGTGQTMRRGYLVNIAYKGMLPNGQVFDQSILHGGPFEFELGIGQVILGWDMVVSEMKKGEKRIVAIPPELAYGMEGAAGLIPPNSYIIFELELTGFTE